MPLVFIGLAVYPRLSKLSGSNGDALLHASSQFLTVASMMTGVVIWGSTSSSARPRAIAGTALRIDSACVAYDDRACARSGRGDRARSPAARNGPADFPPQDHRGRNASEHRAHIGLVPYWRITGAVVAGIVALAVVDVGYALALHRSLRTIVVRCAVSLMAGLTVAAV